MKLEKNVNILEFLPYFLLTLFIFVAFCCSIFIFDIDLNKINFKQLIMKTVFVNVNAEESKSAFDIADELSNDINTEKSSVSRSTSNLTGAYTLYIQYTNNSQLPTGYSSMFNGIAFPTQTYSFLPGAVYTSGKYTVVTMYQIQADYNFVNGSDYAIDLHWDFGSYIYPFYPNSSSNSFFFNGCPGASCHADYSWQADSSHQSTSYMDIHITFRATSNSSFATFTFGNLSDSTGLFYNGYTSQQGIRLSSATITTESTGNSDLSDIENGITTINDNLQDINDTLTDSSIDNGLGSQFLNLFSHNDHPLSTIVTAPVDFLNSLDDTCSPVSFNISFPGTVTRTVTLPCGDDIFWGRSDLNYVQDFRVFWNILFGGALIYTLGFMLFKTINRALDPFVDDINGLEV